eukprot:365025-Chlamydomonas_euryale.AAC.5
MLGFWRRRASMWASVEALRVRVGACEILTSRNDFDHGLQHIHVSAMQACSLSALQLNNTWLTGNEDKCWQPSQSGILKEQKTSCFPNARPFLLTAHFRAIYVADNQLHSPRARYVLECKHRMTEDQDRFMNRLFSPPGGGTVGTAEYGSKGGALCGMALVVPFCTYAKPAAPTHLVAECLDRPIRRVPRVVCQQRGRAPVSLYAPPPQPDAPPQGRPLCGHSASM